MLQVQAQAHSHATVSQMYGLRPLTFGKKIADFNCYVAHWHSKFNLRDLTVFLKREVVEGFRYARMKCRKKSSLSI
jgi:hypothetical protein